MKEIGTNALYLGPVFESSSHGYDTADYRLVDRRLGKNADLKELSDILHKNGIRLALDGVFNHSGRDFGPFRDLLINKERSVYRDWFSGIDFSVRSPYGDPFGYSGWNGHLSLVKFDHADRDLRNYLFETIRFWKDEFGIDGLRLDAADSLDFDFMRALSGFCRSLYPDFWLMGEVIHGDYRRWANPETLDSVTNYELYKGLWSSHNDHNYFEIAYSLNRLFGQDGIYKDLALYNFADNHDVDRIASKLKNPAHLYTVNILLYTMPGIPSVYYGSEWGIRGLRGAGADADLPLRPALEISGAPFNSDNAAVRETVKKLGKIRHENTALKYGSYRQILVNMSQFAFAREAGDRKAIICVNSSDKTANVTLGLPKLWPVRWKDLLGRGEIFEVRNGNLSLGLDPCRGKILAPAL